MNNYEVVFTNGKYLIVELKTKFVIKTFDEKQEAHKLAKKLNRGYAFAGETPSFFVNKKEQLHYTTH